MNWLFQIGFLQLEDEIIFDVNRGNNTVEYDKDYDAYITVIAENEQPTGTLKVNKSINLREEIDTTLIKDIDYTQIAFELKASEDIIDYADGSVIYKKDKVIDTYNLKADGTLEINNLPMGSYKFYEISTIDGAVLDDTIHDVVFTQKDTTTKVYTVELELENHTTIVEFSKTDITGEKELEGATLTITDSEGNIVDSWISGEKTHKIEGLVVGKTYTLKEEVQVDSYVKASDINFKIENTKDIQKVTMVDKVVDMSKVDIGGNEIEGAKMQVLDHEGNIIDEWISEKEPHKIKNLEEGKSYILHEEVSIGYFVKATDEEFEVSYDKETQHLKMIDKIVDVTKTDMVNGEEVEGAELIVTDEEGNEIDRWVSGKEPHHVVGLEEGKKYFLEEITCPYGYEIAEKQEFTVSIDKETQIIEMKDMPILTDVKLIKIDSKTKEKIYGDFSFGIYADENCNELIEEKHSNSETASITFEDIRYGIFYIKELSSPSNYSLSNEVIKLEINDKGVFVNNKQIEPDENEIYSFEFENAPIETPNTGDNSHLKLIGGIMILSILGIALLVIKLNKKNKEDK